MFHGGYYNCTDHLGHNIRIRCYVHDYDHASDRTRSSWFVNRCDVWHQVLQKSRKQGLMKCFARGGQGFKSFAPFFFDFISKVVLLCVNDGVPIRAGGRHARTKINIYLGVDYVLDS